jgi:hypothetical protein
VSVFARQGGQQRWTRVDVSTLPATSPLRSQFDPAAQSGILDGVRSATRTRGRARHRLSGRDRHGAWSMPGRWALRAVG